MPRQGLQKNTIIQAAIKLIEKYGISQFSMGKLAKQLNVKTASLYNHVESMDKLLEAVGFEVISQLMEVEEQAIEGKQGDDALFALAEAYRSFARKHYHLYRVIMAFPQWDNPVLEQEVSRVVTPILKVLSGYGLSDVQQYHWQRILRSIMVGFAFHEQAGGFSHFPADKNESYHIAIQCMADSLYQAGRKGDNQK